MSEPAKRALILIGGPVAFIAAGLGLALLIGPDLPGKLETVIFGAD